MNPANSWQEAERQFWEDVKEILTGKYQHSPGRAQTGIDEYRQQVRGPGEQGSENQTVYNQGEERTAAAIDSGLWHGWPQPRSAVH